MTNASDFVTRYDSARDRSRVAFAWNGKHAEDFQDANEEFRQTVLEAALANLHDVPVELIRDLYDAETAWAKEAWCVNTEAVRVFAEEMLTRGGAGYVEDFLAGKIGRGMDAFCAAFFDCPQQLAAQLLAEVEWRIASGASGGRLARLEAGRDVLRWWVGNPPANSTRQG